MQTDQGTDRADHTGRADVGLRIYVDTREKPHAIKKILAHFDKKGVEVVRQKLNVGDYMTDPDAKISVDRKQTLGEVVTNMCQQHRRFSAECQRAKECGVQLVFLVEHGGKIRSIEDVPDWENPRLSISPYAVSGPRLYQLMKAYESKYSVRWEFCCKQSTGKRIIEILAGA